MLFFIDNIYDQHFVCVFVWFFMYLNSHLFVSFNISHDTKRISLNKTGNISFLNLINDTIGLQSDQQRK